MQVTGRAPGAITALRRMGGSQARTAGRYTVGSGGEYYLHFKTEGASGYGLVRVDFFSVVLFLVVPSTFRVHPGF